MTAGNNMAAAAMLERLGYGCEISPAYCDVILRRVMHLTGDTAMLAATKETFAATEESRGVPADAAAKPVLQRVNFLCAEPHMYVHGQVIGVNGGLAI